MDKTGMMDDLLAVAPLQTVPTKKICRGFCHGQCRHALCPQARTEGYDSDSLDVSKAVLQSTYCYEYTEVL